MIERVELGCPGHFIAAGSCRWRRHTQVGDSVRISTVGDLYFDHDKKKRQTLGADPDSFFETMLFRTEPQPESKNEGCGCLRVADWSEIDRRRYATAGEAQKGHEDFVRRALAGEFAKEKA